MSVAYNCDRCGKFFYAEQSVKNRIKNRDGDGYILEQYTTGQLDLCPECYDQLYNWFKNNADFISKE